MCKSIASHRIRGHMIKPEWIESDDEFEGLGAHQDNPRYAPVDESETGAE